MPRLSSVAVACVALLQGACANFDLYTAGIGGNGISGNTWGYQVYNGEPDCDDARDWLWKTGDDVSGYGVRCEGSGCSKSGSDDVANVELYEMNFRDDLHFTAYRERGWDMVDVNDKKVGTCMPYEGDDYHCGTDVGQTVGHRALRCLTNSIKAEDIWDNRPVRK